MAHIRSAMDICTGTVFGFGKGHSSKPKGPIEGVALTISGCYARQRGNDLVTIDAIGRTDEATPDVISAIKGLGLGVGNDFNG